MKIGFYSDLVLGENISVDDQLKKILLKTDYNCVNLECPLYGGEKKSKKQGVCLYSKAGGVSFLKTYNFRMVNLANNHMMDFGRAGLEETLAKLEENSINYFGAGLNKKQAEIPYIIADGEKRIVFFGFAWKYTGAVEATLNGPGVLGVSIDEIKNYLEAYKKCDVRVAYFHFGTEFEDYPEPYLKNLIEQLLEEDYLDVVIGNHPHCIQGIYQKRIGEKEKTAYYSLGNFSIPEGEYYNGQVYYPEKSNLGFGVIYDTESKEMELVPYYIQKKGNHLITADIDDLIDKLNILSRPLYFSADKYLEYYRKNRNNESRPIFTGDERKDARKVIPMLLKSKIVYVSVKFIKLILALVGLKVVYDNVERRRKIIRRS